MHGAGSEKNRALWPISTGVRRKREISNISAQPNTLIKILCMHFETQTLILFMLVGFGRG